MKSYKAWLNEWFDKLEEERNYLSELDQKIGDGDHGNNMARGAEAAKESIKSIDEADLSALLKAVAMAFMSKVGGASGPLYGSAFFAMAMSATKTQDICELIETGLQKIKATGKSEAEEKTMIDVWQPALEALKKGALTQEVLDQAQEHTTSLRATKGRASYYGERSIGEKDPGATSSAYLFEALIHQL